MSAVLSMLGSIWSFFFNSIRRTHKEGFPFILIGFILTLLGYWIDGSIGVIFLTATVFVITFFRDPERHTPKGDNLIISPADGKVTSISYRTPPEELCIEEEMLRVSIFLSVFNCHVNRLPMSGRITNVEYKEGTFVNVSLEKESANNERNSIVIEKDSKTKIVTTQIAGLIAKRIVCHIEEGDEVEVGARYGLIRFGSRLDVYMPKDTKLLVEVGSTTIGAETVIAALDGKHEGYEFKEIKKKESKKDNKKSKKNEDKKEKEKEDKLDEVEVIEVEAIEKRED